MPELAHLVQRPAKVEPFQANPGTPISWPNAVVVLDLAPLALHPRVWRLASAPPMYPRLGTTHHDQSEICCPVTVQIDRSPAIEPRRHAHAELVPVARPGELAAEQREGVETPSFACLYETGWGYRLRAGEGLPLPSVTATGQSPVPLTSFFPSFLWPDPPPSI